jgi:hypothetical protein
VGREVAWEGGCWQWGKGTPRRKLDLLARSHIEKKRKKENKGSIHCQMGQRRTGLDREDA